MVFFATILLIVSLFTLVKVIDHLLNYKGLWDRIGSGPPSTNTAKAIYLSGLPSFPPNVPVKLFLFADSIVFFQDKNNTAVLSYKKITDISLERYEKSKMIRGTVYYNKFVTLSITYCDNEQATQSLCFDRFKSIYTDQKGQFLFEKELRKKTCLEQPQSVQPRPGHTEL